MSVVIKKKAIYAPIVGPLVIDKLAVLFDIPTAMRKSVLKAFVDLDGRFSNGNYTHSVWLPGNGPFANDKSGTTTITFQANPTPKLHTPFFCRVEFNPAHTETADVELLLTDIFGISYAHHVLAGKVSRLDLAVDIKDAAMDQLLVRAPKLSVNETRVSGGRTLYIGGATSPFRLAVYDKGAEIKSKNSKTSNKALHQPVPDAATTRIEIRLKPQKSVAGLTSLENVFARVQVSYFDELLKQKKNDLNLTVLMLARLMGIYPATMWLSKEGKDGARKFLLGASASWWKPDEIWKGLPTEVAKLHPQWDLQPVAINN